MFDRGTALEGKQVVLNSGDFGHILAYLKDKEVYIGYIHTVNIFGLIPAAWDSDLRHQDDPAFNIYSLKPLEFDHWDIINPKYRALAMNENGEWWFHGNTKLHYTTDGFSNMWKSTLDANVAISPFTNEYFPAVEDWTKSLIIRPDD